MSGRPPIDDELDDLFDRPSDVTFAQRLHEAAPPRVQADPAFKEALRRRLMQEAWRQQKPHRPWYRRLLGPPGLAWAGAMAGVLLIVFATVTLSQSNHGSTEQVFTSPQNGSHAVATSASIVVNFPQPMNPATTAAAARITPATMATYRWSNNNQTLTITPRNGGLAPGVQYQVTFAPTATTAANEPLAQPSTTPSPITFITEQPTPAPSPVPTSPVSPTPTPSSQLSGVHQLGPSNGARPVWSLDGSTVYVIGPSGQLTSYPATGGAGTVIASSGVTQVVAGAAGPAYVAGGNVVYGGQTTAVAGVIAIGFASSGQGSRLVAVAGTQLAAVGSTSGLALKATPTSTVFSPTGSSLAYLAADGLHVVSLGDGTDRLIGAATAVGDWSPDGSELAYIDNGVLSVLDLGSASATPVSGISGVTAVSWTADGLLVSTSGGLVALTEPNSSASSVAPAPDTAASWSPVSAGIAYVNGGNAYLASVDTTSALAAASNVVSRFMFARQAGNVATAESYLAPSALAEFTGGSGLSLTSYGAQTIKRWSILLAEPSGLVAVRTVFAQGSQESVFDEEFQTRPTSAGQYLISQATATGIGSGPTNGPEIESISVAATSVSVKFDSDLNPASVAGGVAVQDASGTPLGGQSVTYSAATRTVTVTVPALAAGQDYQLQLAKSLKDVDGSAATAVAISFTSVTTPAPSPSPSPSPTASPTPQPGG